MTASVILAEAAAIERGQAAWHRAMNTAWPRDQEASREIQRVLTRLWDALDRYRVIRDGVIHPGAYYPELEHDDEAYDKGLRLAADAVGQWADELDGLLPAAGEGDL